MKRYKIECRGPSAMGGFVCDTVEDSGGEFYRVRDVEAERMIPQDGTLHIDVLEEGGQVVARCGDTAAQADTVWDALYELGRLLRAYEALVEEVAEQPAEEPPKEPTE